jgi:hypothetical protein
MRSIAYRNSGVYLPCVTVPCYSALDDIAAGAGSLAPLWFCAVAVVMLNLWHAKCMGRWSALTVLVLALLTWVAVWLIQSQPAAIIEHLDDSLHSRLSATSGGITGGTHGDTRAPSCVVFLGIFSVAADSARRHLIRHGLRNAAPLSLHGFVLGVQGLPYTTLRWLGAEAALHFDLLTLGVRENMNHGKTLAFFARAAQLLERRLLSCEWIAKVDSDTYVVWPNLVRELVLLRPAKHMPSLDGAFGWPCTGSKSSEERLASFVSGGNYFCGALYALTADLAAWVGREAQAGRLTGTGSEDKRATSWWCAAGRGKNAAACGATHCKDMPGSALREARAKNVSALAPKHNAERPLAQTDIFVHRVKAVSQWKEAASFFEPLIRGKVRRTVLHGKNESAPRAAPVSTRRPADSVCRFRYHPRPERQ